MRIFFARSGIYEAVNDYKTSNYGHIFWFRLVTPMTVYGTRARLWHKGYMAIETIAGKAKFSMVIGPFYIEFSNPEEFTNFVDALDPHIQKLIEEKNK